MLNVRKKESIITCLMFIALFMIPIYGKNYTGMIFAYIIFIYYIFTKNISYIFNNYSVSKIFGFYAVFCVISLLPALFQNVSFDDVITKVITKFYPVVLVIIGYYSAKKRTDKQNNKMVVIILLIQSFIGFFQMYFDGFRTWSFTIYGGEHHLISFLGDNTHRAVGTLANPNYYGITMAILGAYAFYNLMYTKNRRAIWIICVIAAWIGVFFSASKTSVLCLAISIAIYVLFFAKTTLLRKILFSIITILACIWLLQYFQNYTLREINVISMSGRSYNWAKLWEMYFVDFNIFSVIGYGIGFSGVNYSGSYADSYWMIILLEHGILGLLVYVVIWVLIILHLMNKKDGFYKHLLLALIIILFAADFTAAISAQPQITTVIYYFIGYLLYNVSLEDKERKTNFSMI